MSAEYLSGQYKTLTSTETLMGPIIQRWWAHVYRHFSVSKCHKNCQYPVWYGVL